MKGFLKFAIFAGVLAGVIFGGLKYLDYITFDYLAVVDDCMDKFYTSSSKEDIKPILEYLDRYTKDIGKVQGIQEVVADKVDSWVLYIGQKYLCNNSNANACEVQLTELEVLQEKVDLLSNFEGEKKDQVLASSDYKKALTKITGLIETAQKIVNSASSTSPMSSFEAEKKKCESVPNSSCERCSEVGLCSCIYQNANGAKEELTCLKPALAKQ